MGSVSKFNKVSFEQFKSDWLSTIGDTDYHLIKEIYDSIKLPERATSGSAGYDFHIPHNLTIKKGESVVIPTGIRCLIKDKWVLLLLPRSGQGFKYGIHLANTVGVIDSDYYHADNEGHIFIKLVNDSTLSKDIELDQGDAICQGLFMPFGLCVDDKCTDRRYGGLGSTDSSN